MKKRRFPVAKVFLLAVLLIILPLAGGYLTGKKFPGEPTEVKKLRGQQVAQTDEGHQEYYFHLLDEKGQRGYREMLEGIRNLDEKFYLSLSGDDEIDKVYHAVLKDHPELFWIHNREKVYKTTFDGRDYCQFSPGYSYTKEERQEILQAMEDAYREVLEQIPDGADDYQKVMTVYTYIIDNTEYVVSENDQSIAGTFWKKQAVCAGYAGAVQYLLERLGVTCIYVEGDAKTAHRDMHGTLCGWTDSIIMWMLRMVTSRISLRGMRHLWRNIRQRSMTTCARFRRNMRRIIQHRMSLRFRHVLLRIRIFM